MNVPSRTFLRVVALAAAAIALYAGNRSLAQAPPATKPDTTVDRGRYLVEQVAMCGDCHTPHGPDGAPDKKQWLRGAIIDFTPKHEVPGWVPMAPRLAGLRPGWDTAAMAKYLETGTKPDGSTSHPPMPAYRFHHEDAEAAAAYLASFAEKHP